MKKICRICEQTKSLADFYKSGKYYRTECKACHLLQQKNKCRNKVRTNNKKYYSNNREKENARCKQYQLENKKNVLAQRKEYREKNKDKIRAYEKEYRKNSRFAINESRRKRHKERYSNDLFYKLSVNLRTRMYRAVKNHQKSGSAVNDLGCSITELKNYLELMFGDGMSWDNYGEWHIDHIIPLSSFDLSNRLEFLKACNYTNLQPLWAKENIKKGASHG